MANPNALVMGLSGSSTSYTEKIPPYFDGHSSYRVYRADIEFWQQYTTLEETKRGVAIIARLAGEAKSSAVSIENDKIFSKTGVTEILEKLDKLYLVDKTDQLDIDLTSFLDYTWKSSFNVEQFIAGFHTRLDKISSLALDEKLKGHLLLRQAGLDSHTKNMIIGAASGSYDVTSISNSLRQAFRSTAHDQSDTPPPGYSTFRSRGRGRGRGTHRGGYRGRGGRGGRGTRGAHNSTNNSSGTPSFYTYLQAASSNIQSIVDSGASASVVGKNTLDHAMKTLGITSIDEGPPKQPIHRFGDNPEEKPASMSVKDGTATTETIKFNVNFDVLDGDLPFLIGFPTLKAMQGTLNFKYMTMGIQINDSYYRIPLRENGNHALIDFKPSGSSYFSNPGTTPSMYSPSNTKKYTYVNSQSKKYTPGKVDAPKESKTFDPKNLKKLHLQLKHGTHTAMRDYLRSAGYWNPELDQSISSLLQECSCKEASRLRNQSKLILEWTLSFSKAYLVFILWIDAQVGLKL